MHYSNLIVFMVTNPIHSDSILFSEGKHHNNVNCEVEGWLDLKPYIKELLKKANKYLSCKALNVS